MSVTAWNGASWLKLVQGGKFWATCYLLLGVGAISRVTGSIPGPCCENSTDQELDLGMKHRVAALCQPHQCSVNVIWKHWILPILFRLHYTDRACSVLPVTPSQSLWWLDMVCPWSSCSSWELVFTWYSLTRIIIYFKPVELSIKDPCHPILPKFGVE